MTARNGRKFGRRASLKMGAAFGVLAIAGSMAIGTPATTATHATRRVLEVIAGRVTRG